MRFVQDLCLTVICMALTVMVSRQVYSNERPAVNDRLDTNRIVWDTIPMPSNDPLIALDTCNGRMVVSTINDVITIDNGRKLHAFQPLKHVSLSDAIEVNGVWFASSSTAGLSYTTNQGMTWHHDGREGVPKAIASLSSIGGRLVAVTTSGELVMQESTGWRREPVPYGPIRHLSTTSTLLFALTDTALAYKQPGVGDWQIVSSGQFRRSLMASFHDTCLVTIGDSLLRIVVDENAAIGTTRHTLNRLSPLHMAYGACGLVLATDRLVYHGSSTGAVSSQPRGPWADTKRITSCDCVDNNVTVSTNDPAAKVLVIDPLRESRWRYTTLITNTDSELDIVGVRGTPSSGVFVRARREGLWHSADSGKFAINVSNPMVGVKADAVVRIYNDFFVSTMFGGTITVSNCGTDVGRIPRTLPYAVGTMVVTVADTVLVACLLQDRYYASYNRGVDWTPIPAPDTFGIVDKMFGIGNTVYLANPKGLRYAEAPNFVWRELEKPSDCLNVQQMKAYRNGIVLNCVSGTFFKPTNGNWRPFIVPDSEGPARFSTVAIDGGTFVGAGKLGLYRTSDGGESWDFIPTPTRRRFIILGVYNNRVWGFIDNGTVCHGVLP